MSTDHAEVAQPHAPEWELSWAPLVLVGGILFLLPLTFSAYFVYESTLLTIVFAGIGVPLVLVGVARWIDEGLEGHSLVPGAAGVALPIFIVSEIFIFLALFATYWLIRLMAPVWPPEGTPDMPTVLPLVMTVLLISSSVTIHVGEERMAHDDRDGLKRWLWITLALGTAFLGCTVYEYSHLLGQGFGPDANAFSTNFFAITGFHASHVLLGLLAFVAILIPLMRGRLNRTFVKCVSIYWHFVDVVWIFVVTQIYFW